MVKLTLIFFCVFFTLAFAQSGRFRTSPSVSIISAGRYNPEVDNSGRYRSDNSGQYSGNDGRYHPDNSGRYSGNDGRYTPDNSGRYNGNDGRYTPDDSGKYNPDGSGAYSGQNGGYRPDGSGRYSGQSDKYQGDKYGTDNSGIESNSGKGTGVGSKGGLVGVGGSKVSGSGKGSKVTPSSELVAPNVVKGGLASGKYENRNYAILRQEGSVDEDGYHYLYETENGILGEEQGKLHNRNTDEEAMRASGFFTYTGPDNVVYTVRYTADENGFVPQGEHLPTPPPIPEAILRALEWQSRQAKIVN